MKKRAVEPFFKGDPARALGPRSGIGLPIANGIARAHGGTLRLLDRARHGLIARLVLPRNLGAPMVKTSEQPPKLAADHAARLHGFAREPGAALGTVPACRAS